MNASHLVELTTAERIFVMFKVCSLSETEGRKEGRKRAKVLLQMLKMNPEE